MKIETERLILRTPRKSDWKDILEGAKELDVSENLLVVPHPYAKKDAEWFINDTLKKWAKKEKEVYSFFIELKSEKKVIGVTAFSKVDLFQGIATSGSWINKKYWRKGYVLEAKIAANEFAFNKLKLRRLSSAAYVKNKASNAMSKKLGYKIEGTLRKAVRSKATGTIHDENIYGILKEEWKKILPKLKKDLNKKLK